MQFTFNSLDEFYTVIDTEQYNPNRRAELTVYLRKMSESLTDENEKEKISWETFFFDFLVQEGQVKSFYPTMDKDGNVRDYPSYTEFTPETYRYLIERSNTAKSNLSIIRYNQILWKSPTKAKNQNQAKKVVNASLDYIQAPENLNLDYLHYTLKVLKNGIAIAKEIKYKLAEFSDYIKSVLFVNNKVPYYSKCQVLRIASEANVLDKDDYQKISKLILSIVSSAAKKNDSIYPREALEIGLAIARKFSLDTKIWFKRLGDRFVKDAEGRMSDDTNIIPLEFYQHAIELYRQAGAQKAVSDTEEKYNSLKENLNLKGAPFTLNEEESKRLREEIKETGDKLLAKPIDHIFGHISHGIGFFPQIDSLQKSVEDLGNSFMDVATVIKFDINNNIYGDNRKIDSKKERLNQSYSIYIFNFTVQVLNYVFVQGYLDNKINYNSLINFFVEKTWLGIKFKEPKGNISEEYCWLNVIAPSLLHFFQNLEAELKSKSFRGNYILAIDSLVLKFEGAFREFAGLLGVNTTVAGKNNILREMYIEDILKNKKIKEYFSKDDLYFFNYIFTSKDGLNLRNNIAHAFFKSTNYSLAYVYLLICAFLRLGKYNIKPKG